jgi:phosphatidylserine/phosphatidylglycerophosphate/cardiolipin synthase-like enzyme
MKGKMRKAAILLALLTLAPSAAHSMGSLPTGPSEEQGRSGAPAGLTQDEAVPARVRFLADRAFQAALRREIDSARSEVVLSLHLFTVAEEKSGRPGRVAESLAAAAGRGVDVIVVLEIGKEVSPVTQANRRAARLLTSRGVSVYADMSGTTVHSKLAVIDRKLVFIGSHDLTAQSLGHYREASLLVDSPELATTVLRYIESLDPVPYR